MLGYLAHEVCLGLNMVWGPEVVFSQRALRLEHEFVACGKVIFRIRWLYLACENMYLFVVIGLVCSPGPHCSQSQIWELMAGQLSVPVLHDMARRSLEVKRPISGKLKQKTKDART